VKPEVGFFIAEILAGKLLSEKDFDDILQRVGIDSDLNVVAQEALNQTAAAVGMDKVQTLVEIFEAAMASAIQKVNEQNRDSTQRSSELEESQGQSNSTVKALPDFSKISSLSQKQLKEFVVDLLRNLRELKASDLHLSAKSQPFVRNCLRVERITDYVLTEEDSLKLNTAFLSKEQLEFFDKNKAMSFALPFSKEERYRTTLITHKDGVAGTYHIVPDKIFSLEELGFLPENINSIMKFLEYHNGLILVTGPVGSGKTTTLASLVNIINQQRTDHVIMVENPIEIVQTSQSCNVTQREINKDTQSYARAIKAALREDPDIIVIGELSDLETIQIAITASETGHLVIGTMQTSDSINTLNRIINSFPPFQQPQMKAMIAGSLRGIICQRLLPKSGNGIALACELLVNNLAISNTIMEGKFHLIMSILQTGAKSGMCTMDDSIFNLFKNGIITEGIANSSIINTKNFEKLVKSLEKNK